MNGTAVTSTFYPVYGKVMYTLAPNAVGMAVAQSALNARAAAGRPPAPSAHSKGGAVCGISGPDSGSGTGAPLAAVGDAARASEAAQAQLQPTEGSPGASKDEDAMYYVFTGQVGDATLVSSETGRVTRGDVRSGPGRISLTPVSASLYFDVPVAGTERPGSRKASAGNGRSTPSLATPPASASAASKSRRAGGESVAQSEQAAGRAGLPPKPDSSADACAAPDEMSGVLGVAERAPQASQLQALGAEEHDRAAGEEPDGEGSVTDFTDDLSARYSLSDSVFSDRPSQLSMKVLQQTALASNQANGGIADTQMERQASRKDLK